MTGSSGISTTSTPISSSKASASGQARQTSGFGANGAAAQSSYQSQLAGCASLAFQQVKQTQASMARLSRHVHPQAPSSSATAASHTTTNQSSQAIKSQDHQASSQASKSVNQTHQQQQQQQQLQINQQHSTTTTTNKSTNFVDCLIRRFKNCFNEDFCTVPMFVVGNLSPGSDGTHLILPPCVSLCGQNISRFASPKNLRLMNSIRESCHSIEELDLGANKLTDLIEIYKILQCTPNLKFLNLSENDLSRTAPVAMASPSGSSSSSSGSFWPSSPIGSVSFAARSCLAPINQNQSPHQPAIGSRRHSTLGQPTSASASKMVRPSQRLAEARRLTATAALAQSKKTSSSVASKLTHSAARPASGSSGVGGPSSTSKGVSPRGHPSASTMHLARSLSSLSAKDVRSARLASSSKRDTTKAPAATKSGNNITNDHKQSPATAKLFVEPTISEGEDHDDVEMSSRPPETSGPATTAATRREPRQLTPCGGLQHFRRTFESIKALALNNTSCQWRTVCSILSRMPNLEELHLSLNNYEKIDLDASEFKHISLRRLYLCNNPKLTDWQELSKLLIAFPSLEALSIADCNISQIPENLDRAREWRKLCGLNINGWPIKEWPVIERLNQLPSLIDLKCRNLDILDKVDEPRHHLIARLPKLQRLNGSEIEERDHAEKAFLRFFVTNSHLERPTRFHELMRIHGEVAPVDVDVDVDLSPPSQATIRVIYLNSNYCRHNNLDDILMSGDFLTKLMDGVDDHMSMDVTGGADSMEHENEQWINGNKLVRLFKDESQEVVSIEVDLRQSVRKFKQSLASLFRLASQNLILYYIDHEMVGLMGPELIKHNQKKLWNYNVQDGDQFIVEER